MNVCMQVKQESHEILLDKSSPSCQISRLENLSTLYHSTDYEWSFSLWIHLTWFNQTFLKTLFSAEHVSFAYFVFVQHFKKCSHWNRKVLVSQSCPILWNPWAVTHSPPGSSVHGILQARILEWLASPFSGVSSLSRDWTQVSCTAGRFFTAWTTREVKAIGMRKY